jgi:hypothetical protein
MAINDDQDEQVKKLIAGQMGPESSTTDNSTADSDAELADKVADSHPGHTPASIDQWVQGQEKQVDQYGPEQEKAVINNIIQNRNSFQGRAANAGAGLADSIMQGVAQQGSGHFQEALNQRQNQTEQLAANAVPQLASLNKSNMGEKQALEGITSGSPLGASKAAALKPILQQLYPGKTDAEYAAMLQNPEATAANLGIPASVLESKAKLAETHLENELRRDTLGATIQNNAAEREQARNVLAQTTKQEETKNELEHPVMMELKKLFGASESATPDGRVTVISPDGKTGHIPASQLKDALAKGYKQP